MKKKILFFVCSVFVLGGCQGRAPLVAHPLPVEYVSASSSSGVEEYISAWEEAQEEMEAEKPKNTSSPTKLPAQKDLSISDLWGKPLTSSGQGVTLQGEGRRQRLDDALDTTPLGGVARWEDAGLNFLFIPNSPVYTPHHSGGRCRDGIFAVYGDGFHDQRLRGLFCQTGPGADWLLKMHIEE